MELLFFLFLCLGWVLFIGVVLGDDLEFLLLSLMIGILLDDLVELLLIVLLFLIYDGLCELLSGVVGLELVGVVIINMLCLLFIIELFWYCCCLGSDGGGIGWCLILWFEEFLDCDEIEGGGIGFFFGIGIGEIGIFLLGIGRGVFGGGKGWLWFIGWLRFRCGGVLFVVEFVLVRCFWKVFSFYFLVDVVVFVIVVSVVFFFVLVRLVVLEVEDLVLWWLKKFWVMDFVWFFIDFLMEVEGDFDLVLLLLWLLDEDVVLCWFWGVLFRFFLVFVVFFEEIDEFDVVWVFVIGVRVGDGGCVWVERFVIVDMVGFLLGGDDEGLKRLVLMGLVLIVGVVGWVKGIESIGGCEEERLFLIFFWEFRFSEDDFVFDLFDLKLVMEVLGLVFRFKFEVEFLVDFFRLVLFFIFFLKRLIDVFFLSIGMLWFFFICGNLVFGVFWVFFKWLILFSFLFWVVVVLRFIVDLILLLWNILFFYFLCLVLKNGVLF